MKWMSALVALAAAAVLAVGLGSQWRAVAAPQTPSGKAPSPKSSPAKPDAAKAKAEEITWEDLWPEGEDERLEKLFDAYMETIGKDAGVIAEGSAGDMMPQIGTFTTVAALNNKRVRLPGYIVPLDFNAKNQHSSFLLVPYFGACIHTPPPPPNQIVYITAKPAVTIKDVWAPIWVEGVMTTERKDSKMADAAYALSLTKLEPYER
jgi:hypothetical protein